MCHPSLGRKHNPVPDILTVMKVYTYRQICTSIHMRGRHYPGGPPAHSASWHQAMQKDLPGRDAM